MTSALTGDVSKNDRACYHGESAYLDVHHLSRTSPGPTKIYMRVCVSVSIRSAHRRWDWIFMRLVSKPPHQDPSSEPSTRLIPAEELLHPEENPNFDSDRESFQGAVSHIPGGRRKPCVE